MRVVSTAWTATYLVYTVTITYPISSNSYIFWVVGGIVLCFHSIPSFLHPELRAALFFSFYFIFLNRKSRSWLPKSRSRIDSRAGSKRVGSWAWEQSWSQIARLGAEPVLKAGNPKFGSRTAPGAPKSSGSPSLIILLLFVNVNRPHYVYFIRCLLQPWLWMSSLFTIRPVNMAKDWFTLKFNYLYTLIG